MLRTHSIWRAKNRAVDAALFFCLGRGGVTPGLVALSLRSAAVGAVWPMPPAIDCLGSWGESVGVWLVMRVRRVPRLGEQNRQNA